MMEEAAPDRAETQRGGKSPTAFRTISEVADELDVPQHVLRFWESKFSQLRPLKRGGRRRYYRPEDVALLRRIKELLYVEGYTIRGVQRLFREVGTRAVVEKRGRGGSAPQPAAAEADAGTARPTPAPGGPLSTVQRASVLEAMKALHRARAVLAGDRDGD